jgi:hypothetical protein
MCGNKVLEDRGQQQCETCSILWDTWYDGTQSELCLGATVFGIFTLHLAMTVTQNEQTSCNRKRFDS